MKKIIYVKIIAGLANLRRRIRAMEERKKEKMSNEEQDDAKSESDSSSTDTEPSDSNSDQVWRVGLLCSIYSYIRT